MKSNLSSGHLMWITDTNDGMCVPWAICWWIMHTRLPLSLMWI